MSRWLHAHLGRRGECLLFFGGLDLVYAWSMLTSAPSSSSTYAWFGSIAPLPAWAFLWAAVGIICLYHAFHRYDRFGFIAAIGIKVIWGLFSVIGCVLGDVTIGSVGIWLGLAGLVWRISGWAEPEPSRQDEA